MKSPTLLALLAGLIISGCSSAPKHSINKLADADFNDHHATGILAQPLPVVVNALQNGDITAEQLVQLYLARIQDIDKNGPKLQSILTLNPDALNQAKLSDQQRLKGDVKGPLHGVPILLKDNIESKDNMPTTAGALALKNNATGRDSPLVAGLRNQGAIILGKTNLSQWANFRSEDSLSGWSVLGGQVRNPHMLDRNPCGSSSGSGAATAASLAAATVGTETNGSVICPANANGVVGFKPTVGIVPQQYIIPISASQDTAGPMTKTVMGTALMMNAMATTTPDIDYTAGLTLDALAGVRVGVLNFAKGNSAGIRARFTTALEDLEKAGAILVHIEKRPAQPDNLGKLAYDILKFEFKDGLNNYLASTSPTMVTTRSLEQLIAFNQAHQDIELALFDQSILEASQKMGTLDSQEYQSAIEVVQRASRQDGIDKLLQQYQVDVLVAPSGLTVPRIDPINGDVWPNGWPGYGSHAARAGYPHATVPMGAVNHLSVGMSFIGTQNSDAQILAYAFAYEQHSQRRLEPRYLSNAEAIPAVARAMAPYEVPQKSH
ncbi:amidase [Aliiglaciecola litoralis]|uniref:Amidase n=1 Tax=Aliiglaciecola litoralis TaxID=582857 RepID=A0ABN1LQ85_9ALTE